ncbi:MAG: apolipoprotein N-acyltransferase [Dissulfurimicrobium sp.]|uniref:apolipoprotein N-acyltransferase n=1 Tax=Dissulfurimicrobium TaxID=1769732 RepID=UPI001EDB0CC5|nr:apolipoprotein N-acyltransferase [Dissulfurimicrobium hydrothermale]UKL13439.1 apolipoprotein N-acyltransferase [Dissulfurimicrobium hydrothermale]
MDWLLPIISGLLLTSIFPPFSIGVLIPVALVPLLCTIKKKTWKEAFRYGFAAGICHFGTLLWWIAPTIARYGKLPLWASWPVVGLLACYLAVYPAAWSAYISIVSSKRHPIHLIISVPAAWVILEWIRGHFLSGFPWGSLAYSLVPNPSFIQTADIYGPYGLSFLIVLANMILWDLGETIKTNGISDLKKPTIAGEAALLIFGTAFLWYYGEMQINRIASKDALYPAHFAAAIQGSIPQDEKWDPAFQQGTIGIYKRLSKEAVENARAFNKNNPKNPIIIWPETAAPFYFQDGSPLSRQVLSLAKELKAIILFGSPSYSLRKGSGDTEFFNSAYAVTPNGMVAGRYDKIHLVPFGEYMPFGWVTAWAKEFIPTAGEFQAGSSLKPISWDGVHIGTLICFESIFPGLGAGLVRHGANLIAIITNDAWFGHTGAPYQHEEMAVLRAVETRRWVIRAANTGVSSIISPWGERSSYTKIFLPCYTTGVVHLRDDLTFFVRHGAGWVLAIFFVAAIMPFLYFKEKKR